MNTCKTSKDELLLDLKIGKPFIEKINDLEKQESITPCVPKETYSKVLNLKKEIILNGNKNTAIYIFNLGVKDSSLLNILTIHINGKSEHRLLNFFFPELENKVTKYDLINYFYKIYGNYTFSDSGSLETDGYRIKNIITPNIGSKYTEKTEFFLGDKSVGFFDNNDYLYRWSLKQYDIEVIETNKPFGLFINYKMKNFNEEYKKMIKKEIESYSLDDLVKITFRKPYILQLSERNYTSALRIPVYSINRRGEAEPRTITDLKFDMLFFDEFDNLIFTWKDFTWDREISFSNSAYMNGPEFEIKYISGYKDHKELNLIEKKLDKISIKTKITAIRFEDGTIKK